MALAFLFTLATLYWPPNILGQITTIFKLAYHSSILSPISIPFFPQFATFIPIFIQYLLSLYQDEIRFIRICILMQY